MAKRTRNPLEEIEELFEKMSRQIEGGPWTGVTESIPVDVVDDGDQFIVTADLPGYDRDDIDLTLSTGKLRIDASRREEDEIEEETSGRRYIRRERRQRSVSRTVSLPGEVDTEEIKATYNNGILSVTLPKAEIDDSQRIEIE